MADRLIYYSPLQNGSIVVLLDLPLLDINMEKYKAITLTWTHCLLETVNNLFSKYALSCLVSRNFIYQRKDVIFTVTIDLL